MLSVGTACSEELKGSSGGSSTGSSEGSEITGDDTEVLDCADDKGAEELSVEIEEDDGVDSGDGVDTGVYVALCSAELEKAVLFDAESTGTSFLPSEDTVSAAATVTAHPVRTIHVYFAAIPIFLIFIAKPPNMINFILLYLNFTISRGVCQVTGISALFPEKIIRQIFCGHLTFYLKYAKITL